MRFDLRVVAKRALMTAAVALPLLYAATLAILYFGQERLIFPGTPLASDFKFAFDEHFEEIRIPVAGATLNALRFTQPHPRGLVFFLHGNVGNLATWTTGLDFYKRVNYDLFMLDYRGYGKSTGRIASEAQLHADVRAAWDYIAPQYRGTPIVIYGRSLGTGLAAALARDVDPALLVLVSPYANLGMEAKRAYPVAPSWLLRYPLATDTVIGDVKCPILLVHGSADTFIVPAESERLRSLAHAPVQLEIINGAAHDDVHKFPAYLDLLSAALIKAAAK